MAVMRWCRTGLAAAGLAAAGLAGPARAGEDMLRESAAGRLAPGEFLWRPALVPQGPVSIVISVPRQIAWVYRDETLIGITSVSTGRPGHATPTGPFTILEKRQFHRSNLYSNAPMPFMQRLTWSGVALHAGHNPGFPASHGCIRLPAAFARLLFGETALGSNVVVTGEAIALTAPDAAPAPMLPLDEAILEAPLPGSTGR